LTVKLLVERFRRRPIKPNHLKSYNRTPASLLWARFPFGHGTCTRLLPISFPFAGRILKTPTIVGHADSDQEAAAKLSAIQMQYCAR
jgi:hypothetical protein